MAQIGYEAEHPRTMYDKIWADHVVSESDDGTCLIYIDRHLVHEVAADSIAVVHMVVCE